MEYEKVTERNNKHKNKHKNKNVYLLLLLLLLFAGELVRFSGGPEFNPFIEFFKVSFDFIFGVPKLGVLIDNKDRPPALLSEVDNEIFDNSAANEKPFETHSSSLEALHFDPAKKYKKKDERIRKKKANLEKILKKNR